MLIHKSILETGTLLTQYRKAKENEGKTSLYKALRYSLHESNISAKRYYNIKKNLNNISLEILKDYSDNLDNKLFSIVKGFDEGNLSPQQLVGFTSDIEEAIERLKGRWNAYTNSKLSSIIAMLKLVNKVVNDSDINNTIAMAENFRREWPVHENTGSNMKKIVEHSEGFINKLGLNENIKEFLYKLSSPNVVVTLQDITPEIVDWLKSHNFERSIKITL